MAIVYADNVKTGRLQAMADLHAGKTLAAATGSATAGSIVIGTAALSGATGVLATIPVPTTGWTVSGTGTVIATLQGVPLSANASASGTAAKAELRNNAGTVIASGLTVGTSGSDINLTTTSITSGQPV